MEKRRALITGVTGQDGSYLAEYLATRGYEVFGVARRASTANRSRVERMVRTGGLELIEGDVLDAGFLTRNIKLIAPDEVYHLAAQSFVGLSWDAPDLTVTTIVNGTLNVLEAIRAASLPATRFYHAGSSEMFGGSQTSRMDESTPFVPRSPYATAKIAAHHLTMNYREAYGMFAVSGILFNHESSRRSEEFVTRKITRAIGRIKAGTQHDLKLGNVFNRRDWGHAEDYVVAMHLMLQADKPKDYVVATGQSFTVSDFYRRAFDLAGLDPVKYVTNSDEFQRPSDVQKLQGYPRAIEQELGWTRKHTFESLIKEMVEHDIWLAQQEADRGEIGELAQ